MNCPVCKAAIPLSDVNVATDIALCRRCGQNFSYAELANAAPAADVDLTRPPKGAWFKRDARGFELGSTMRHPIAFFLVPFMLFWSGLSLGGIYGTQFFKREFNPMLSLMGIPFLLGTALFGSFAAMSVCGKTSIRVENDRATLFAGIGRIGFKKRFKWSEVRMIEKSMSYGRRSASEQITIHADRELNFANGVKNERRNFLLAALRQMQREKLY